MSPNSTVSRLESIRLPFVLDNLNCLHACCHSTMLLVSDTYSRHIVVFVTDSSRVHDPQVARMFSEGVNLMSNFK